MHTPGRLQLQIAFRKTPDGLWIPKETSAAAASADDNDRGNTPRPAAIEFALTTAGWKDVIGSQASLDDIVSRLRRYSLRELASMTARISIALKALDHWENGRPSLGGQRVIASRFLGDAMADQMIARARKSRAHHFDQDRFVFFQERQTLNAFKIGLLVVDAAVDDSGEAPVPFIEALLMLTDLLDEEFEGLNLASDEGRSKLELYIAANVLFNAGSHLMHDIVRAHYLYIEGHPEIGRPGLVDLPATLARSDRMDAETVWRALFALYAGWGAQSLEQLDAGEITVSRASYLSTMPKLQAAHRERWLSLAMSDIDDLQRRVRDSYSLDEPRFFDVLPFEEHPLVAFGDTVFCVSLPLLTRLPAASLQHRFMRPDVFTDGERRRFLDTRGQLVERYTVESLTRAYGARFVPEHRLQEAAKGASVCDGVIIYPDAVILVECKTGSPLLTTRHAENYAAYREKWRKAMRKAADQFESTTALLRSNAFAAMGIESERVRAIYPVVAVFEQLITPLTYRAIVERDLAGHSLLERMERQDVAPLQLIDIEDVEFWEMAADHGRSVLDLLREKVSDSEMAELSFHYFIHLKGETFQQGHCRWHEERFERIMAEALDFYRSLGMAREDDE